MHYYKILKPNTKGQLVGMYPLNDSIRVEYPLDIVVAPKVDNSKFFICEGLEEADYWYYDGFDSRQMWLIEAFEVEKKAGFVMAPTDEEVYSFWKGKTKDILLNKDEQTVCSSLRLLKRIK